MNSSSSSPMAVQPSPNTEAAPASAVTIAICTSNRCDILAETLAALLAHEAPGIIFDVLVVDNASTDATREVVDRFRGGAAALRYVWELTPGISHARNRALEHVSAPYVVFVDDDIIPAQGWLNAMLRTFHEVDPRPAAVGGPVHLRWTNGQPDWLPDELLGIYSYIDYGPRVQPVRAVHGCNMAFPTALARQYGFDAQFGLSGSAQVPGEDTDMLIRMQRDGLPVYFQPGALVWHIVGAYRENRAYVMRRSRGVGRQQALLSVKHEWSGRRGVLALMARDAWNRRHWWKRITVSLLSGKLLRSARERTWTRHALVRFSAFQRAMLGCALKGKAALGDSPGGAAAAKSVSAGR